MFSIGFGKELCGFNDRHGTRWKLSAIPLGGYVKFFGDENAASVPDRDAAAAMNPTERKESFVHQPVGPRAAIVVAGPLANFILAIAIFAGLFMLYGKQSTAARVESIQPESAAAAAGFQPGDLVLSINGRAIESFGEMQRIVSTSAGETLTIEVDRGGTRVTLKAVPTLKEVKDNFGNVHRLGVLGISRSIAPSELKMEPVGPATAVWLGVKETWTIVETTLSYIGRIVVGRDNADQLGGPDHDRPGLGTGGHPWVRGHHALRCRAVGLDRLIEPVPGAVCSMVGTCFSMRSNSFAVGRCPNGHRRSDSASDLRLLPHLWCSPLKNDIFRLWNWAAS